MKTFHYSRGDGGSSRQRLQEESWPTGLPSPGTKNNPLICSCQALLERRNRAQHLSLTSLILAGTQENARQWELQRAAPALSGQYSNPPQTGITAPSGRRPGQNLSFLGWLSRRIFHSLSQLTQKNAIAVRTGSENGKFRSVPQSRCGNRAQIREGEQHQSREDPHQNADFSQP